MSVSKIRQVILLLAWGIFCIPGYAQVELSHQFIDQKGKLSGVKIIGTSSSEIQDWQFFIHQSALSTKRRPSILGKTEIVRDTLFFRPILPFQFDQEYQLNHQGKTIYQFKTPKSKFKPPSLVSYSPKLDTIPANLLKVYLHFSEPMQEGKSGQYITVTNTELDTLNEIFLDLQPELWNADNTRLTLWIDPGRLKRALASNDLKGKPLQEDSRIIITINNRWESQQSIPLGKDHQINYLIGKEDRIQPSLKQIKLRLPKVNHLAPLLIDCGETFDVALLARMLSVCNDQQVPINGIFELNSTADQLRFTPDQTWNKDTYFLKIDSALEDLAGNNFNRLFDVDLIMDTKIEAQDYYWIKFKLP